MDIPRPTILDTSPELSGVKLFLDSLDECDSSAVVLETVRQLRASYDCRFIDELRSFSELAEVDDHAVAELIETCAVVAEYYELSPEKMSDVIDEILVRVHDGETAL